MRYFIETKEVDEEEFNHLLYEACKCEILSNKKKVISQITPFKNETLYSNGVILAAIEKYFWMAQKELKEDFKAIRDEAEFRLEKDEE